MMADDDEELIFVVVVSFETTMRSVMERREVIAKFFV